MNQLNGENLKEKLNELKTPEEQGAYLKDLLGPIFDGMIEKEVDARLGDTRDEIRKKILALKSKGMTLTGILEYLKENDNVDVSPRELGMMKEDMKPLIHDFQNRPLNRLYPVVFLDAMQNTVRDGSRMMKKSSYTVVGINEDGMKEILGIWIANGEGAKFWQGIISEIKNRGADEIIIACIDGLKGFRDAIKFVYPNVMIQRCIVHLIRDTSKNIRGEAKENWCNDLRNIYTAPTEAAGYEALQDMKAKWPEFVGYLRPWEDAWADLSTFFKFSPVVRKLIYTTNAVESVHSRYRKILPDKKVYASDEDYLIDLYLAQREASKSWKNPIPEWAQIFGQLSIEYPERLSFHDKPTSEDGNVKQKPTKKTKDKKDEE